jgi:hypothetical protein
MSHTIKRVSLYSRVSAGEYFRAWRTQSAAPGSRHTHGCMLRGRAALRSAA